MQSNTVNAVCLQTERDEKKHKNVLEKNLASGKNRAVLSYLDVTELNSVWLRPSKRELPPETNASTTRSSASLGPPFPLAGAPRAESVEGPP